MTVNQKDDLLAMQELNEYWQQQDFKLLPHQYRTVTKVIKQLDGRALLADEVGLGKTIEAGMILKEYLLRGLVETCLILTPVSLGFQWWRELNDKFKINLYNNRKGKGWHYFNVIISSLDRAKREPHRSAIYKRGFDLVIVDEAHRLKNEATMNWKFVNNIPKKYLLLLTATPLQNDLKELYNLINLLRPELYQDYNDFKARHVDGKRQIQNLSMLQEQLSQVMIRNKREDFKLATDNNRELELLPVELTTEERKLYEMITKLVQQKYKSQSSNSSFQLLTLQREVCSSSFAVAKSLQRMLEKSQYQSIWTELKDILKLATEITNNQKLTVVKKIMAKTDTKVIIFTEYKATQQYLGYNLYHQGYNPIFFSGDLSDSQKEWAKARFENEGDILISTEAGGQGINLQFCNTIINYDLPWNPMKLEQRIGRVDRLGQTNDVVVYNLITTETIEERILALLFEKVDLFETVTGDQLQLLLNEKQLENDELLSCSNQLTDIDYRADLGQLREKYLH
ncbi:DEAD/DEAH box helicase [Halanaerobacter jeridensis]|uniref:SNF2 family DNA or RNA helicase n=1 Tax=Halanaerobacter jeridensis TaxID=706427 RepID=A0A938XQX8_9FIRM|nr:SNF2-related protein [Halanaerobacter jeridensis]MBM7557907.1 SNF2 family DNA or RNA helicase [Halanaerobacter jeridensis]